MAYIYSEIHTLHYLSHPTRSFQYVGVIRAIIPLTHYLYFLKMVTGIQLRLTFPLHTTHTLITCISHSHICISHYGHMYITLRSHVYHTTVICISHYSHMYITLQSHEYHMYITLQSHVYHMYITLQSHEYHMYITLQSHVYHMYITLQSHVYHISDILYMLQKTICIHAKTSMHLSS